jgi:mevalonate kinase
LSFSAHGKVILLGEHAVVYGHPSLCGALTDGATVEVRPGRGLLSISAWQVTVEPSGSDARPIAQAYRALRRELGAGDASTVDFHLRFAIPTGAGLGSSAAMAVALSKAICQAHGLDGADIARAALASEVVIHGTPSGLDHTVALQGGFGVFTRRDGLTKIPAREPVRLCVGHTGKERDTKGRVARVGELLNERGAEVRQRFQAIEELVHAGQKAVASGAWGALGQAMNENQRHLEALEVSCPEIERLCTIARDAGALGAKLTGGGGGGCVIALTPAAELSRQVIAAWERAGSTSFAVEVGR